MLLIPACPSGALDQGAVGRARNLSSALADSGPTEHREIFRGARGDYLIRVTVPIEGEPVAYIVALFQERVVIPGEGVASYLTLAGGLALIQIGVTDRFTGGAVSGGTGSYVQELNIFGAGGVVGGGAAGRWRLVNMSGKGGVISGGRALVVVVRSLIGKGGAVSGGRSLVAVIRSVIGKGGSVTGGNGAVSVIRSMIAAGGGIGGGRSTQYQFVAVHCRDGAVAGGRALQSQTRICGGYGGVVVSGRARILSNDAQLGRGGSVAGSRAVIVVSAVPVGRGGAVIGGSLSRTVLHLVHGGAIAGGTARRSITESVRALGGAVVGGKVHPLFDISLRVVRGGAVAGGRAAAGRMIATPVKGGAIAGGRYKPGAVAGVLTGSGGVIAGSRAKMVSLLVTKLGWGGMVAGGRATLSGTQKASGRGGGIAGGGATISGERLIEPTIVWPVPADIPYLTPLTTTQLNAVAMDGTVEVAGEYQYDPPLGTVLEAGGPYSITVIFTPRNTTKYTWTGKEVLLTVTKIPQPVPVDATFGFPRNDNFEVFIPLGSTCTVLPTGGNGTGAYILEMAWTNTPQNAALVQNPLGLTGITVMPIDGFGEGVSLYRKGDRNYLDSDYAIVCYAVVVQPGSLALVWQQPAMVEPGTVLTGTQLNAEARFNGAMVSGGTYTYAPPAGTVIAQDTVLAVTYDHPIYGSAHGSVLIRVNRHELRIIANNASRSYRSSNPVFSWRVEGLPPGVTLGSLITSGSPALSTTAGLTTDCGTYPISVDVSGFTVAGYTLIPVSGVLTITKIAQAQLYYTISNVYLPVGSQARIVGSGGSGSGAFTYSTTYTNIISLNNGSGYFTGLAVGAYMITIYKDADINYGPAQGDTAYHSVIAAPPPPPPPPPPNVHTYDVVGKFYGYYYDGMGQLHEEYLIFNSNGTVYDVFYYPQPPYRSDYLFSYTFEKLTGRGYINGGELSMEFQLSYYSDRIYGVSNGSIDYSFYWYRAWW